MKKLNKALAMGLAAVCMLGTVTPTSAATRTVTSYKSQGTLASVSVDPAKDVHMYGSAICTTGNALGDIAQWDGKMWGSLALAYTTGACSFGHDGSTTNILSKSLFVTPALKLETYHKEAKMFTYYNEASTKIYY